MPRWLAWTLGALFVLALFLHAHGSLFDASGPGGYSQSDLRALFGVSDCLKDNRPRFEARPYFEAKDSGLEPLGALSLALSTALWSNGGAFGAASPLPMRIENLMLFALAAAGAGVFLRRLLLPWLGDGHARAAAWVAAILCMVHPLAYAGLVSLAARGDLIALALGSWSGAQFLRARQVRAPRAAIGAGICALLAGFASPIAWSIPFVLAASEFLSARRYRVFAARARTTLVTLCVYGATVAVGPLLRAALGFQAAGSHANRPASETIALALEKLGVLALPVNPASLTFAAYLLAATLLVVAVEPAFSAARSAPRLWSLILSAGAVSILCASFSNRDVRVEPLDFTRAEVLLPGLFTVCAGLALASTALTGLRRTLMPAILATGWAAIAHVHAGAWVKSIEVFSSARREVAQALAQEPAPAAILLLDVPPLVRGLAPLDRARTLSMLAAPQFIAVDGASLARERAREPRPILVGAPTRSAFVQFARTERFARMRERGISLAMDGRKGSERIIVRLAAPTPTGGTRRWYREGTPNPLDWEALGVRCVTARGPRDTDFARTPRLGWNGKGGEAGKEIDGVWIDVAGEPTAYFDVDESVEWLCAGRVILAWPVGGWSNLADSDAQDEMPKFEPMPVSEHSGDDWKMRVPASPIVDAATATLGRRGLAGEWRLLLCDLETLEQESFDLLADPIDSKHALVAREAGRVAAEWSARGHELAWSLEFSAAGVVLVRSEGLVLPSPAKDQ